VTTVAAVTERRSVTAWLAVVRGRPMAIVTRTTFGVPCRGAITTSLAGICAALSLALPIMHSLPVASGVGNSFLLIIAVNLIVIGSCEV